MLWLQDTMMSKLACGVISRVKLSERERDHWDPSDVEAKLAWNFTFTTFLPLNIANLSIVTTSQLPIIFNVKYEDISISGFEFLSPCVKVGSLFYNTIARINDYV
jgi:hypothetical protein